MKIRYILYSVLLFVTLVACRNDEYLWGNESYARIVAPEIWTHATDSMTFTFSTYPADITEFVLETEIIVQGKVVDYDRTVHLQVRKEKTTATEGTYSFPSELIVGAGMHSVKFDILLHRTEEMLHKDVRLCVGIAPTGDLKAGVNNFSSLTIVWNDKITKPSNWDDLTEFFGEYSEVKYRFIITTLGVSLFPYGENNGPTWGQMTDYRLRMAAALEAYNVDPANPDRPMKDENGGTISF